MQDPATTVTTEGLEEIAQNVAKTSQEIANQPTDPFSDVTGEDGLPF